MRYFNRGQTINFLHTFYDSSGDIASPSTASLRISHPSTVCHGDFPPVYYKSTTAVLTQSTDLTWSGSWDSHASGVGTVFYHIEGSDASFNVDDGYFEIRANQANRVST